MRRPAIGFGLALLVLTAVPGVALADLATTSFDPVRVDRATEELVLTGTISCTESEPATVTVFVTQATREAGGSATVSCGTTPAPWEIRLPLGSPPYHPGPAVLDIGFAAGQTVSGRSVEITILPR